MYSLTRNFLKVASAATVVALAALSTPASATEMVQNLGPVSAYEPILKTVGNKQSSPSSCPATVSAMSRR